MVDLSYWRLSTGVEVDFILGDMKTAVEAKATRNAHQDHLKGLRELKKDHPEVGRRIIVCLEDVSRKTEDGIEILNYRDFSTRLWNRRIL